MNKTTKILKKNCEMAKKIAKIRDNYTCRRCWKTKKQWASIHWSHIICEKRDHRLAGNPDNIVALCYSCHFNFRHKHPVEAYKRLDSYSPWLQDKLWVMYQKHQTMWSIWIVFAEEQQEKLKSQLDNLLGKKPKEKKK